MNGAPGKLYNVERLPALDNLVEISTDGNEKWLVMSLDFFFPAAVPNTVLEMQIGVPPKPSES